MSRLESKWDGGPDLGLGHRAIPEVGMGAHRGSSGQPRASGPGPLTAPQSRPRPSMGPLS